jgi:hypothetical protein
MVWSRWKGYDGFYVAAAMSENEPTELTCADVDRVLKRILNSEIFVPKCSWCNESFFVREVGANFICVDCEKKERAAGRSLVLTTPVRGAYWSFDD